MSYSCSSRAYAAQHPSSFCAGFCPQGRPLHHSTQPTTPMTACHGSYCCTNPVPIHDRQYMFNCRAACCGALSCLHFRRKCFSCQYCGAIPSRQWNDWESLEPPIEPRNHRELSCYCHPSIRHRTAVTNLGPSPSEKWNILLASPCSTGKERRFEAPHDATPTPHDSSAPTTVFRIRSCQATGESSAHCLADPDNHIAGHTKGERCTLPQCRRIPGWRVCPHKYSAQLSPATAPVNMTDGHCNVAGCSYGCRVPVVGWGDPGYVCNRCEHARGCTSSCIARAVRTCACRCCGEFAPGVEDYCKCPHHVLGQSERLAGAESTSTGVTTGNSFSCATTTPVTLPSSDASALASPGIAKSYHAAPAPYSTRTTIPRLRRRWKARRRFALGNPHRATKETCEPMCRLTPEEKDEPADKSNEGMHSTKTHPIAQASTRTADALKYCCSEERTTRERIVVNLASQCNIAHHTRAARSTGSPVPILVATKKVQRQRNRGKSSDKEETGEEIEESELEAGKGGGENDDENKEAPKKKREEKRHIEIINVNVQCVKEEAETEFPAACPKTNHLKNDSDTVKDNEVVQCIETQPSGPADIAHAVALKNANAARTIAPHINNILTVRKRQSLQKMNPNLPNLAPNRKRWLERLRLIWLDPAERQMR
eukprot:GHVT01025110.1.p1 GENE.GHVT01025110.1~~GHVT01025110.1.p1  ORF type:complete len:655 (+),score=27.79 GHVT01025110.1:307-2271(+)